MEELLRNKVADAMHGKECVIIHRPKDPVVCIVGESYEVEGEAAGIVKSIDVYFAMKVVVITFDSGMRLTFGGYNFTYKRYESKEGRGISPEEQKETWDLK